MHSGWKFKGWYIEVFAKFCWWRVHDVVKMFLGGYTCFVFYCTFIETFFENYGGRVYSPLPRIFHGSSFFNQWDILNCLKYDCLKIKLFEIIFRHFRIIQTGDTTVKNFDSLIFKTEAVRGITKWWQKKWPKIDCRREWS